MHARLVLRTRVSSLAPIIILGVLAVLLGPPPARGAPADPDPVGEWPLRPEPAVVEGFDPPDDPWGAGHRGVDLLGSPGQRVHAALPGRISFAGMLAGRGVVVVNHGDTRTTYEPVSADVDVGDIVVTGDPIGQLQTTGSHCLPRTCLHWGWLRGETYLDPLDLVNAGPVRLLPLWREEPVARAPTRPMAAAWSPVPLPYASWRPMGEAPLSPD